MNCVWKFDKHAPASNARTKSKANTSCPKCLYNNNYDDNKK